MNDSTTLLTRVLRARDGHAVSPPPAAEEEGYKAYGVVPTERGAVASLVVWLAAPDAQGRTVWVLPYVDFTAATGSASGALTLTWGRVLVQLRGRHLFGKFLQDLADHRITWLKEWHPQDAPVPDDAVCLETITIDER
jgi:hypothetical protein